VLSATRVIETSEQIIFVGVDWDTGRGGKREDHIDA
jgi:hypothetical protein